MPVYNVEKYLSRSIDSVLKQTYRNFKLLIIDDGSKDSSGKMCDEYASRYPNIISVRHQDNVGLYDTRGNCIEFAREQIRIDKKSIEDCYVMFLDSDDYLRDDTLMLVYDSIQKHKGEMFIFGRTYVCENKVTGVSGVLNKCIVSDKHDLFDIVLNHDGFYSITNKCVCASLLNRVVFDEVKKANYGEDIIRSIPLLLETDCCVFIDDAPYYYEINPASICGSLFKNNYFDVKAYFLKNEYMVRKIKDHNLLTKEAYDYYIDSWRYHLLNVLVSIKNGIKDKNTKYRLYDDLLNNEFCSILFKNCQSRFFPLQKLAKKQYGLVEPSLFFWRVLNKLFNISKRNQRR